MTKLEEKYYRDIIEVYDVMLEKHSFMPVSDLDAFEDEEFVSEMLRIKYAGEKKGAESLIVEASEKAGELLARMGADMIIPAYYYNDVSDGCESLGSVEAVNGVMVCLKAVVYVAGLWQVYECGRMVIENIAKLF